MHLSTIQHIGIPEVVLALLLAQVGSAQPVAKIDPNSQPAVDALRAIARTISQCPEALDFEHRWGKGPLEIDQWYYGSPRNVIWDVVPSGSVRAPYLGYIEFATYYELRVPRETTDRYERQFPGLLAKANYEAGGSSPKWRYEFDVGPEGIELTRALVSRLNAGVGGVRGKKNVGGKTAARTPRALPRAAPDKPQQSPGIPPTS